MHIPNKSCSCLLDTFFYAFKHFFFLKFKKLFSFPLVSRNIFNLISFSVLLKPINRRRNLCWFKWCIWILFVYFTCVCILYFSIPNWLYPACFGLSSFISRP